MTKISRAISHLRSAAQTLLESDARDDPEVGWALSDDVVTEPAVGFVGETPLQREQRKCAEYFDVIVRIEHERNGWIDMYRTQVSEHLTAQGMLEKSLVSARQMAARAVKMLNKMREDAGLEAITAETGLKAYDGEPVGIAEKYAARMKELHSSMPAVIDGEAERQKIRAAD
jgi:hypothetical protein